MPNLETHSDTGAFGDDNITQGESPQFDGTASDTESGGYASGVWKVEVDSDDGKSGTDDASPFYTVTLATLDEGQRSITATVYDVAGNSFTTDDLVVTVDSTPPAVPGAPDLQVDSDTGSSPADNITAIASSPAQTYIIFCLSAVVSNMSTSLKWISPFQPEKNFPNGAFRNAGFSGFSRPEA